VIKNTFFILNKTYFYFILYDVLFYYAILDSSDHWLACSFNNVGSYWSTDCNDPLLHVLRYSSSLDHDFYKKKKPSGVKFGERANHTTESNSVICKFFSLFLFLVIKNKPSIYRDGTTSCV